jgi:hypothetical protein
MELNYSHETKTIFRWLVFQNMNAAVQFSGLTRPGLVLVAFGLPVSGEWLAAARPRGIRPRRGFWIDFSNKNAAPL